MTSDACPHCGQVKTSRHQWGPLLVTRQPAAVYWRGVRQPNPSPLQHSILFTLAQRGEAAYFALEQLSLAQSSNSIAASMSYLRRWINANGLPLKIKSVRGMGFRLALVE